MRCHVERGYGNLTPYGSTLWVRVKRHATHHWLYSFVHRRYVEGYCKSSSRHGRLLENTLLVAEGICITIFHWSLDLSFSDISGWCHWSVLTWLWCIDQFYILFWIRLGSGTAYCLNWRYLHWFDIEITSCVVDTEHWEVYSLQVMRTQLETLGEEFKLAGKYLMERTYYALSLGPWDALALWGQWPYLGILFVWEFCNEMFRYCEDNTYIIVIVTYESYTWSYGVHFIVPEKTLVTSMRTTPFWEDFVLQCGLATTVVERLQRYNCIWLTYIDNVEQNILFYIEIWSCEMLSLCGKLIWRRNVMFGLCFVSRRRLYRYLVWITSFLWS